MNLIREIGLDNLKKGELCIFAGAGISYNSGIPLVNRIKEYIVDKLCDEKQEQESMLRNKIPFEIFMEILLNNYHPDDITLLETHDEKNKKDQAIKMAALALLRLADMGNPLHSHKKFFDLFGSGSYSPNTNHYFIARMLANGYINFAATTNFDILIEKAYKEITNKELKVYFPGTEKIGSEFPCLFKIHGGCQDLSSIQTTIEKIASNKAKEHCRELIEYTFKNGIHSKVLVLGYSFSDVFDITPCIENIRKAKKNVIVINHSTSSTGNLTNVKNRIDESQPIFRGFNGYQINCNTDEIIQALWKTYFKEIEVEGVGLEKNNFTIEENIGKWAAQLSHPHQRAFICGLLMAFVGRSKEARNYFNTCLSTNEISENTPLKIVVLQNMLMVDPIGSIGRRSELNNLLSNASQEEKIKSLINTVQVKLLERDTVGALSTCRQALSLALEIKNKRQEGLCHAAMAHVLNERKEYKNAVASSEKALTLLEDITDFEIVRTRCRIYCYLIASYENLNMEEKKQQYYSKALELANKLNIENEMAVVYFSLAHSVDTDVNKTESLRKCINYYKLGYEFCKKTDAVMPMIKDSSLFILGANILQLYLINSNLVTIDELNLAYELIKGKITDHSLDMYGNDVLIEEASFMTLACLAVKKYEEGLEAILSKMSTINMEKASSDKRKQILYTLLLWFQEQAGDFFNSFEYKMDLEEVRKVNAILEEANCYFKQNNINKGAQALSNAFRIIPVNFSFRENLPFSVYQNILNVRIELGKIYDALSP